MENSVADGGLGESGVVIAQAETPPTPVMRLDTLWREPFLLDNPGHRYSVGWYDARKLGGVFVVGRRTAVGSVRVADRFPLTDEGWASAWAALVKLDDAAAGALRDVLHRRKAKQSGQLAERDRQAQMFEMFAQADQVTVFGSLGVQVISGDDHVYTTRSHNQALKLNSSRVLGALAGAQAMVTDGAQAWSPGRALLLPVALTVLATKTKADAAIVFSGGAVHTAALDGNAAVRQAQLQVVQFNALAGTSSPVVSPDGNEPAARLRTLEELRDADLISQQEYETRRAAIINSI